MNIKQIFSEKLNDIVSRTVKEYADEPSASEIIRSVKTDSEIFTAGFGKSQIRIKNFTSNKYYIAGFSEKNVAAGISDPLFATALWIDDNSSNGGHLLISLDIIGLMRNDTEELKKILKPFCLTSHCRSVTVLSTGNHSAPDTIGLWGDLPRTGKNNNFISAVYDAAVNAAVEAYNSRKEGRLLLGYADTNDLQYDIREPETYKNTATRLRFNPSDGSKDIFIINFSAVPMSYDENNKFISPDYPYFLRKRIKEKTGAEAFFGIGAAAGVIAKSEKEKGYPAAKDAGDRLADAVLSIKNEKALKASISYINREYYTPVENPVLSSAANLDIINTSKYTLPYEQLKVIKTEISYLRIDFLKILMVPGLIFPELVSGEYMNETDSAEGLPPDFNPTPLSVETNDINLLVFSLANDHIGYIIPPNDFLINPEAPYLKCASDRFYRKHYEERYSLGASAAVKLQEAVAMITEELNNTSI